MLVYLGWLQQTIPSQYNSKGKCSMCSLAWINFFPTWKQPSDTCTCLEAHHGVPHNSPKVIYLPTPIANTTPRRGSSDAILETITRLCYPWRQPIVHLFGVTDLLCSYSSLASFFSLNWRCRQLFIFFNLHSPHSSPSLIVSGVKLWMKSTTLCFLMTTQIILVENFLSDVVWTTWDSPPLHVLLSSLLDWGRLLVLLPLETIRLVIYGMLLPSRSLKMAFVLAKWASLWIQKVDNVVAFALAAVTNKGCLVQGRPPNLPIFFSFFLGLIGLLLLLSDGAGWIFKFFSSLPFFNCRKKVEVVVG